MHCKVEMDSLYLSQHTRLITGKISNLRLKDLGLFFKFKPVTSVGVALFCCSTLGLEGAVLLSKGVETAEKTGVFFFFSFHKPVSNLECSKPVSSDYNSSHFMKLPQVPLALLEAELMEELNCLLHVRRLMLTGKN